MIVNVYQSEIVRLVRKYEERIQTAIEDVGPGRECLVCGDEERPVVSSPVTVAIDALNAVCPDCGSPASCTRLWFAVGGYGSSRYLDIRCSGCSGPSGEDMLAAGESIRLGSTEVPFTRRDIFQPSHHVHHTDYERGETTIVCPSCHAKIHNTDGFRDDLLPVKRGDDDD